MPGYQAFLLAALAPTRGPASVAQPLLQNTEIMSD
jgi:hypothetical protein